jgi:hypothetical protein
VDTVLAADLLSAWERGGAASPAERALVLLSTGYPDVPAEAIAGWTVGRRDAALFALREGLFGPRLSALASCPQCSEPLEMEFTAADVSVDDLPEQPATRSLTLADYRVTYRLPTAGDLALLAQRVDRVAAERWLLARCVLEAHLPDGNAPVADLPDGVLEAVADDMATADPQADVELALSCPACAHHWQAPFDIVSFMWREVEAWARRTLAEVATLATAFGWSERDILAMTPWRRRQYLELAAR